MLALPISGLAQEASIIGVVTDETGGVMPGVTVTVTHDASGNTVTSVTNERGEYSVPARTGAMHILAELGGFATINRAMELLVGQRAVINLQMTPAALSESVTVTGASPLLDTTQSKIGGNIDRRQMQELPVNGRNFLDLTMLAPGSRANSVTDSVQAMGQFQINIDGQQVTQNVQGGGTQMRLSKDTIEEFQFISSRFDATQGRSAGVQVNVVTKSGTNNANGTFSGYFRDDKFIAKDFVSKTVLPYQDQQLSGTYGGPIIRDKFHYFGSYEFEREPGSFVFQSSAFPKLSRILSGDRKEHKISARLDYQLSEKTHIMVRGTEWRNLQPYDQSFTPASAGVSPANAIESIRNSAGLASTFTTVLSGRALNVLKIDQSGTYWDGKTVLPNFSNKNNPNTWAGPKIPGFRGGSSGTPNIAFTGYSIGTPTNHPQRIGQETITFRDDVSYLFNAAGRHGLKVGGEFIKYKVWHNWCNIGNGQLQMTGAPPANVESYFPDIMDPNTWNVAGLSPLVRNYRYEIGGCQFSSPRNIFGSFVQDDWEVTSKLTLNLGARYDFETGTYANEIGIAPWIPANRPNDTDNYAPRLGAAYKLTDKTVLRGGWGKYFSELINQTAHNLRTVNQQVVVDIANNGRPDFAVDPWNGAAPTFDRAVSLFCSTQNAPLSVVQASAALTAQQVLAGQGCLRRAFASSMPSPYAQIPYSYQGTFGFQQQFTDTMGIEADYVWTGTRHDRATQANTNLNYNPATGANYAFTDLTKLPYPQFGVVGIDNMNNYSNYKALQAGLNKRFSHNYQWSATFSISSLKDSNNRAMIGADEVPASITLAPDLAGEYGPAVSDQKYRGTVNGIWSLKYGFQLSGLYFYGSGQRFGRAWGSDLRNSGASAGAATGRLRPDGTIIARNDFIGESIHRVDIRVLRSFKLGGKLKADATFEVFNLFNHANYGSYTTQESNANFGKPSQNANVAFAPRTAQFGFRVQF